MMGHQAKANELTKSLATALGEQDEAKMRMDKLYETLEVGTPVIAFYRDPVTLITENCKISNAYSYRDPDKKDE